MPKYKYRCTHCQYEFEIQHGMEEREEDCPSCKTDGVLIRIPSFIKVVDKMKNQRELNVGDLVKQHIRESRLELKQMKDTASKEEYIPNAT